MKQLEWEQSYNVHTAQIGNLRLTISWKIDGTGYSYNIGNIKVKDESIPQGISIADHKENILQIAVAIYESRLKALKEYIQ